MSTADDLVQQIAEVLAEHGPVIKWGDDTTYCECGFPGGFNLSTDHDRHVAEVLADRLNLHEERRVARMTDGDVGLAIPLDSVTSTAETLLRVYRGSFIQSRLVSGWTEEQQ